MSKKKQQKMELRENSNVPQSKHTVDQAVSMAPTPNNGPQPNMEQTSHITEKQQSKKKRKE